MDKKEMLRPTPGPYVRSWLTTGAVMYDVVLALLPAAVFGAARFGAHALLVLLTSVLTAVLTEFAFDCLVGKDGTIRDGSAVVTGLLLGLTLPASVPLYIPFAGAAAAVVVVKGLFGGLGANLLNPALGARCLLTLAFGSQMASSASVPAGSSAAEILRVLIAHPGGLIGCSAVALLAGGIYLLAAKRISWQIPVSFLAAFCVFTLIFGSGDTTLASLLSQMAGGILLAALFMATDPVTSPVSAPGQLVFGVLAGLLAAVFLRFTGPAEAACLAVLASNLAVPLIDARFAARPHSRKSR